MLSGFLIEQTQRIAAEVNCLSIWSILSIMRVQVGALPTCSTSTSFAVRDLIFFSSPAESIFLVPLDQILFGRQVTGHGQSSMVLYSNAEYMWFWLFIMSVRAC